LIYPVFVESWLAVASSMRVFQVWRLNSSTCMRPQNDSTVSQQTLRNWRRQDQVDRHERDDGLTTDERAELAKLRRENTRLRQERDLLKRAAAFFATESGTR
jgi:transposase